MSEKYQVFGNSVYSSAVKEFKPPFRKAKAKAAQILATIGVEEFEHNLVCGNVNQRTGKQFLRKFLKEQIKRQEIIDEKPILVPQFIWVALLSAVIGWVVHQILDYFFS